MSNNTRAMAPLTTQIALDLIAYDRAPKYHGRSMVTLPIVCADGWSVSVQASWGHYCEDSNGERPAFDDTPVAHPYVSFELGYPDGGDLSLLAEQDTGDSVYGYVPRATVEALLDLHGGAVAWREPAGADA